jgi:hypothetical protein
MWEYFKSCLFVMGFVSVISTAHATTYSFTTIDNPGFFFGGNSINDSGDIVGIHTSGITESFLRDSRGNFTTIVFPGATSTSARGINNSGDIVGSYLSVDGIWHGFLRDSGGNFTTIDYPGASDIWTLPYAINNSGAIVGYYYRPGIGSIHGFLYVGGDFFTIDYPLASYTLAEGINDTGDIVGSYRNVNSFSQGFLRDAGGNFTTIAFPGATSTFASGINNSGDIVGTWESYWGHGFFYSKGSFNSIDGPFSLDGINGISSNLGLIVGVKHGDASGPSTFVATPSGIISTPEPPGGATNGITGICYFYSTGGSTSTLGNPVEYQFDWNGYGSDLSPYGSAIQSKTWTTGGTYNVRVRSRDAMNVLVVSDWSPGLSVTINAETVSTPVAPSGPTTGIINASYAYTTGGSTSSNGSPVKYQFDWKGDGSDLSSWGAGNQIKAWTVAGSYNVSARARSTTNVSIISGWSSPLTVAISVPKISVTPTTYEFGNVKVKKSKTASFRVTNSGTADLSMSTSIAGADASMFRIMIGGGNKTIKPGKTLTIRVAFRPASTGSKSATLEITSNDPVTPTVGIALTGTGQ